MWNGVHALMWSQPMCLFSKIGKDQFDTSFVHEKIRLKFFDTSFNFYNG